MGISLISGWLPTVLLILGLVSALYLFIRPLRWWWVWVVPIVLVVSAIAAWVLGALVAPQMFADSLPLSVSLWIGLAVAAIGLAIGHMFASTWWDKVLSVVAAILVIATAGNQVNQHFQQYPTVGDLLGASTSDEIAGPPPVDPSSETLPPGPLTQTWKPTGPDIPADGMGKVSDITIPGTVSGFEARPGKVYYPPAYFAENPQPLPVLVLSSGQPGEPGEWFLTDRVPTIMDAFAAANNGIAPIVVVPDTLGSQLANPLCANTDRGNVDTYLATDVPAEIKKQLRVDPDTSHWVFGGFSYGGTCAIQLATNHPDVYPHFVDISGQLEPTFGTRQQTVDAAFNGNNAAFVAVNPMDLMAKNKYPASSGWFVVGSDDAEQKPEQQQLYQAAQQAGMDVQYWESPGTGHDWNTAVAGLQHTLPWIAQKGNLTP